MEPVEEQQQAIAMDSGSLLRMKIVVAASDRNKKEARIVNISSPVQFSDIKSSVLHYFPELEKEDHVVGWVDEEGDYVTVSSDQELQLALAERKGRILKILVKIKKNKKKEDEKCPKIQIPRQYFANLRTVKESLSSQGPVVVHQQEDLEKMKRVIKKHPGIIFVMGDLKDKLGKIGDNIDKLEVCGTKVEKKIMKDGKQKMMIDRIIPPAKALSLLNDHQDSNKDDSKSLSVMFLPLIPGRKKHHCHVLGSWDGPGMICVAFKRRGQQGQEQAMGKERVVGKKETAGSVDRNNKGEEQDGDVQKAEPMIEKKKKMMIKKQRVNKKTRPTMIKCKGDEPRKKADPAVCMVPRKRMKMIASRIFSKIGIM